MLNTNNTKYVGIDYGKKRTGISISDNQKIMSFPYDTVNTDELIRFLENLIKNENIEKIIIGKPYRLNNQLHDLENDIIKLIEKLKLYFPKILIDRVDERFTSKISSKIVNAVNTKKNKRMDKSIIDKISASLILESYLTKISR